MAVPPQAIQALLAAAQGGGGAAAAGQAGGGLGASGATPGFGGGFPGGGGGFPGLGGGQETDERQRALENFRPITGEFTGQPQPAQQQQQATPQAQIRPLDQDELSELKQFLQPQQQNGIQRLGSTQQGLGGAGF